MDSSRQIVTVVKLENTTTKRNKVIVNLIATLDHTLHLTKVHASFVRKVSGKIKMDSQIVIVVRLGNTMIKRNAQQSLIVIVVLK